VVPRIEIVGEAADGRAGAELVRREQPDAVFLDIRMPKASGFEMLREIEPRPYIVFTTAYDEHALRASLDRSAGGRRRSSAGASGCSMRLGRSQGVDR